MSRLTELLSAVRDLDPRVGGELIREIELMQQRTSYGLMFERHRPEAVELPGHPVRAKSKVRLLSPRGSLEKPERRLWTVDRVRGDQVEVSAFVDGELEHKTVAREDVVVVAEFSDRIYPGLKLDETVQQGGDKPFHTVINGENFHVLEQLTFTHENAVDVIYIDPPYNSGATDWKYNNDYVGTDDDYRHSKWLAFMERRLKIAKRLLKPENSVLIVTIDEKEYLRLGLLLEQTFPEAQIQMVTSVIAPSGQPRANQMSRVEEYIYVLYFGAAKVGRELSVPSDGESVGTSSVVSWENLVRRGTSARRVDRENQFYPIFVDTATGRIIEIGDPLLPVTRSRNEVTAASGIEVVWPIRSDGSEGRWRISSEAARRLREQGLLRAGRRNKSTGRRAINYVLRSDVARIEAGEIEVVGVADDGSAILNRLESDSVIAGTPKTVWNKESHNAGNYGSALIRTILPGRAFPFPKSLYAVEDTLRLFVSDKPDAVILDFFAGSGTTAHAVMRLNRQDGGRRQAILVTNNEVSADEQAKLRKQGLRPGDPEWEQWGICDYITKPRIRAAITGLTPDGEPIKGDYKFTDEFPMADGFEENAAFMTLTYESPWLVGNDKAFERIAPMLWLRAGGRGEMIRDVDAGWAVTDVYGILRDLDQTAAFVDAVHARKDVRTVFVVTDDEGRFQQVVAELPGLDHVRLYAEYLRNFELTGDVA